MTLVATHPRHVVTFYDGQETLALAVGDFLGAGLVGGGRVIVVATAAHRKAIAGVLSAAGIDLDQLRESDLYVELDAEDLLSRFLVDGSPDPDLFAGAIRPLLDLPGAGRQTLRVYGEMVDLLWQSGNVQAAHDTENLWNTLGAGRDFALFCGYASACVPSDTPGRDAIADHHHAVVEHLAAFVAADEAFQQFEPTLFAPSASRQFVSEVLLAWQHDQLIPEAELVVSELATNAVIHTGGRFSVGLTPLQGGGLKIEVSDTSLLVPEVNEGVAMYATNGRGIRIVAAIAQRWGVHIGELGKTVWAELPARSQHP